MDFSNASKGIKMVFAGELIQLIGVFVMSLVSSFLGNSALTIILTIVVAAVIPAVISIVGLVTAGKDEPAFANAWQTIVAMLIVQVVFAVLSALNVFSGLSTNNFVVTIFDAMVTVYVLNGIKNIYEQKGIGFTFLTVTKVVFLIGVVIQVVSEIWSTAFLTGAAEGNPVIIGLLVVYLVAMVISYIFYLIVLGGACKKIAK